MEQIFEPKPRAALETHRATLKDAFRKCAAAWSWLTSKSGDSSYEVGRMSSLMKRGFLVKHVPTSAFHLSLGHYVWGALLWPVVQHGPDKFSLGTSGQGSSARWQHVER